MDYEAGYISLSRNGVLDTISANLIRKLECCTLCPRKCKVNRLKGETGVCRTGRYAWISAAHAHFGEEPQLVGFNGSGTIFFTNCNLMCSFCQNFEISHLGEGQIIMPEELAAIMLSLQRAGCHNINLVTPTHVISQIIEALCIAVEQGLNIPLVYNSSSYENRDTIEMLRGVIYIYLPDFKFLDTKIADETCKALDYPSVSKTIIKAMHSQVGDLQMNEYDIAYRGLIVRHLVMPGQIKDSKRILKYLADRKSVV
jgi:putative pyruvate formate lyase activating enzyme